MNAGTIAFWGNFGRGNLGNERTLQALLEATRSRVPTANLRCICPDPQNAEKLHNIPAFPISVRGAGEHRFSDSARVDRTALGFIRKGIAVVVREAQQWIQAVNVLRDTDMLIIAGTGIITDSGGSLCGPSYEILKWSLIAKLRGCKLLFVSVGVEPTRRRLHRWFLKSALYLGDYRSFRDDYSRQYLEAIGFPAGKDPIYPDLAFSLPTEGKGLNDGGRKIRPIVGVGVMDYCGQGGMQYGGEKTYLEYIRKMTVFVAWLLKHGFTVRVLIGDQTYDTQPRLDLKHLLESCGAEYELDQMIDEPAASVDDLIAQLAMTDFVVSPRYHNLLLALMLGKPVISISYNEKNDCLLAGVGLGRFCQPIDQLDTDKLIEQFIELEANAERLIPQVKRKLEAHSKALDEQYALIYK